MRPITLIVATLIVGSMAQLEWRERAPTHERRAGSLNAPITESSGVARGRVNPGVLWTLNDSGNPPVLFAVDTTGSLLASFPVDGVSNLDWEALSAGPCGRESCLWVGDIGDNGAIRRSVVIYRFREPVLGKRSDANPRPLDSLVIRYADGPRDAESLVVDPGENAAIISKGRDGQVRGYWVPAAAWRTGAAIVRPFWELPIAPGLLHRDLITDAALSPDGTRLAVRSYRAIYLFGRGSTAERLPRRPLVSCPIRGPEPVGEGMTWWDARTLVLTSERGLGRTAPIILLECAPG